MAERYFVIHSEEIKNKHTLEEALREIETALCHDPEVSHYTLIKGETIPVTNKIIVSPLYKPFMKEA